MKKKTILMLINGFGVEKKQSYPIYDDSIMPTFAELSKNYLFSNNSVISTVSNYYDAYRNISLDVNELYNYKILDNEIENKTIATNKVITELKKEYDTKNGNLHLFCFVDTSLKIVTHLKEYLKVINPNHKKNVYLHLILSSNSIEDYKYLTEVFSHINMDVADYGEIGFILGLDSISNYAKQVDMNFFFKMFISKVGEKWQSFTQKFDVLYAMKTRPRETKPFIVNSNFSLTENDTFLIINYDDVNLTNFMDTLSNINFGEKKNNYSYYSLFKMTSNVKVKHIYDGMLPKNYVVSNLKKLNATALVICKSKSINIINYFCNGLRNEASDALTFVDIDQFDNNPNLLVSTIDKFTNDLIIIDYELNDCKTTGEIKNKLTMIDNHLKALEANRNGSKYTIILTSLFGMTKTLPNENEAPVTVIFSNELPFLYVDDFLTKRNYLITSGTINDIMKSCYKSLNYNSKYTSLVEKKNGLYKLFFK